MLIIIVSEQSGYNYKDVMYNIKYLLIKIKCVSKMYWMNKLTFKID